MKLDNPLYSGKASGRHAGGVFSFNRGLAIFKKYTIPHQPNSPEQIAIKNRFSYLTKYWANSLTYEQITLWNEWNLPWTDIYGNVILLTGINKFCICNDTLLEAEKPITLIPPTATPSESTVTLTADKGFIKLSINGIPDAEVTAQSPFMRIETAGTPELIQYITQQLGIFWNGMPQSRKPLEKNYKLIYIYTCQTGFNGIEELKIMIQTDTSLKGLQPIRIQRFNKWGFWSGLLTYINQISKKNLVTNGDVYSLEDWTQSGDTSGHDGRWYFSGTGEVAQNIDITQGKTYKITFTVKFITPGGTIYFYFDSTDILNATTSGTYTITRTKTTSNLKISIVTFGAINCWIDDIYCWEV